jgi:hypothetical protein
MTYQANDDEASDSFVLGLEENAIDSLVHAVEHFLDDERPNGLKYTVLHSFHAVELFLKARLAQFDAELIYERPKKDGKRYTVNLAELKKRLQKQEVILSEQDEQNLGQLQDVRNSIEHYRIECNRSDVEEYVGCAIYFLETFLHKELGISLKAKLDEVDEEAYQTLSRTRNFHIRRMAESGILPEMSSQLGYKGQPYEFEFYECTVCEEEAVVAPDPRTYGEDTYCFCCFSHYIIRYCPKCESSYIDVSDPDPTATVIKNSKFFNRADDQEEEGWPDNWGFCERCLEDIAIS